MSVRLCGAVALWFLLLGAAGAQPSAGRVLYSYGTVSAERGGAVVGLAPASPVLEGDTLRTGPFSLLQLRMSDGALISLKADSQFAIDRYRYRPSTLQVAPTAAEGGGDAVALRLLKGGFRTVSGLVGRIRHDEYKVITPILVMGVRGTDYSLLYCAKSCRAAKDGLHAKVTRGAIALEKPDGSEFLLREGEYAFVGPGSTGPVRQLKAPEELETDGAGEPANPEQLSYESPVGSTESTAIGQAPDKSGTTSGGGTNLSTTTPAQQPTRAQEPAVAAGVAGSGAVGSGTPVSGPFTPFARTYLSPADGSDPDATSADRIDPGAGYSSTQAERLYINSGGALVAIENLQFDANDPEDTQFTRATALAETGSDAATGLRWGRWVNTAFDGQTSPDGVVQLHYLLGNSVVAATAGDLPQLPVTGSASYQLIGATSPTDANGAVGTLGGATLSANFSTQTLNHSVSLGINGNTIAASYSGPLNTFGRGTALTNSYNTVTVNGQAITPQFADFSAVFVGPSGAIPTGAGVSYGLDIGDNRPIGGVLVFGRPTTTP